MSRLRQNVNKLFSLVKKEVIMKTMMYVPENSSNQKALAVVLRRILNNAELKLRVSYYDAEWRDRETRAPSIRSSLRR